MRFLYYSLLTLLPFMGLSLSTATACNCPQSENGELVIEAMPCCQELQDCCVQTDPDPEPKQPVALLAHQVDTYNFTLTAVATLTEERASYRPSSGIYPKRPRPPPLQLRERHCRIQSWLI